MKLRQGVFEENARLPSQCVPGTTFPYKCRNIYRPEEDIFFVFDSCHLLKTMRNCLANSGTAEECSRLMKKKEKLLVWDHVRMALDEQEGGLPRLRKAHKLTARHLNLDSYTKMNVRVGPTSFSAFRSTNFDLPHGFTAD